jgi:hypothetical protein
LNGDIDDAGPVCQIAVNKGFFDALGHYEQEETLTHEIFHCFEYSFTPAAHTDSDWILEGLARWADLTLFPDTHLALALKALDQYYTSPQLSLFARSDGPGKGYDAVGFWAHLQDTTGDVWHRVREVVIAGVHGNNAAALAKALPPGDETEFLDSWGSSAFDLSSGTTPDWRMKSPLAGRYYPSTHTPTTVDSSSTFTLAPWSTALLVIGPGSAGPLIEIHLDQSVHGRFGVQENYVDSEITSRLFCSASNQAECQCPSGDEGAVPATTPLPGDPDLGAAADAIGGSLEVTYLSPASSGYCKPPQPKAPSLLGAISCRNLLPGYNTDVEGEFKNLAAKWGAGTPASESETDGTYVSTCFFNGYIGSIRHETKILHKETPEEEEINEEWFSGVIAVSTFTERASSEAIAKSDFHIREISGAFKGGGSAGAGEESLLVSTPEEGNEHKEQECGTTAMVRVKNVVAGFGISGLSSYACGSAATKLLQAVAGEL